jgi:hypothetical protein
VIALYNQLTFHVNWGPQVAQRLELRQTDNSLSAFAVVMLALLFHGASTSAAIPLADHINPYFQKLFETGVDEMSWDDMDVMQVCNCGYYV